MSGIQQWFTKWSPYMLTVLRIMVALLFVEHGTQKMFGFPPSMMHGMSHGAVPPLMALLGSLSGILEFAGGLLLLLGFLTRPVAFVLAGEMAVAYFMVHAKGGFFPINNGGEMAVLYCFIFLYFIFAGAGPISLDAIFTRKASAKVPQGTGSIV